MTLAAGAVMVATGAWLAGGVTVTVRVTAVEARPRLSRTRKLTVKVPAVLNCTAPGFCAVELAGVPPPNVQA